LGPLVDPARRRWRAAVAPAREQDGFILVEVLMSAVILLITAYGMLSGLDGTSKISGSLRAQTVATALAQQDQERMRGLLASDLSNLAASSATSVDGVNYTVVSDATWVSDVSGTADCTSSGRADYLRITSRVTWSNAPNPTPIVLESVVSPPNGSFGSGQGSLSNVVRNRDGDGIAGVTVTANGPSAASGSTNVNGCVFFGYLPVGNYSLTAQASGFVDRDGHQTISVPASVIAQTTNSVAQDYDRAGTVAVSFDTKVGGAAPVPSQGDQLSVMHSSMTVPTRVFGTLGQLQTTVTASGLFPFRDDYAVFAGGCDAADPRDYGAPVAMIGLDPGVTGALTVRVPAVNIAVTRAGLPLQNAHVRITSRTVGCDVVYTRTTDALGHLSDAGLPYGDYDICADDGSHFAKSALPVANHDPAGTVALPLVILPLGPIGAGTCP
jgi:type II secretory pathway pseudopilin PulG